MGWFKPTQVTIENGEKLVTIVSGESIANIQPEDGLIIGSFSPVEISKAYVGAGDIQLIELADSWADSTQTAVPAKVLATAGDFAAATQRLKDATTITSDNFAAMDKWGTDLGTINFVNQAGSTNTARTLSQMDTDVQAIQDTNQTIIDNAVSDSIAAIRYGKLDNPLVHLFKKNKLVDTLKGELSWTRNSGATYIDRYGKLQYSPSPHATNLLTYSNTVSASPWVLYNVTLEENIAISPTGRMELSCVADDASGTPLMRYNTGAISIPDSTRLTLSLIFKRNPLAASTDQQLSFYNKDNSYFQVRYNLKDGSFVSTSGADVSHNILDMGNDTYRIQLSMDSGSGATVPNFRISLIDAVDYSPSHFFGHAQLEESRVANGYVKTEATSVSGSSYVGIDVARQEKEGWLFEGVSTNLLATSDEAHDHLNNAWVVSGTGIVMTQDGTTLPDDITLASLFTKSEDNSAVVKQDVPIVDVGQSVTYQFKVKAGTADSVRCRFVATGGTTIDNTVNFSLLTKEFSVNSFFEVLDYEELKDGWFLITFTGKMNNSGNTSVRADLVLPSGVLGSMYFGNYQVEELPFASSFIPTTDTPATRAADIVTAQAKDNFSPIGEGFSMSFLVNPIGYSKTFSAVCQLLLGGNSFITSWSNNTLTTNYSTIERSDGSATFVSGGTVVPNAPLRISNYVKGNKHTLSVNGVVANSDTDDGIGWESREADTLHITPTNAGFYGHINDYRFYDFALNDLEAALLAGE